LSSKTLKGKYHSEDVNVNGRIILKYTSKKYGVTCTGFIGLGIRSSGGLL
jgi:hypothetical protein